MKKKKKKKPILVTISTKFARQKRLKWVKISYGKLRTRQLTQIEECKSESPNKNMFRKSCLTGSLEGLTNVDACTNKALALKIPYQQSQHPRLLPLLMAQTRVPEHPCVPTARGQYLLS